MPTSSLTFGNVTDGFFNFSNIQVTEVDVGTTASFIASDPFFTTTGSPTGIEWAAFQSFVAGAGSSQTLTFNYDVASNTAGEYVTGFNGQYTVDQFFGTGSHVTAVANIYDLGGNLIATQSFTQGSTSPAPITFTQGQAGIHVTLTIIESIDANAPANSSIDMSDIKQSFVATAANQLCSIGDTVFLDLNGDGVQGAPTSEPGLSGVTVQLMDATGTSVLLTTTTDLNGHYQFANLLAGSYTVKFGTLSGLTLTQANAGSDDATDSDADQVTGLTGVITLTAGQNNTTVDAGLKQAGSGAGGTAAIGDTVFIDTNNNGIQDAGDTAAAGVTVNLLDSATGTILDTKTTDSAGHYAFTNLDAGTYKVQFVKPNGYTFANADTGSNDAIDSDANTTTGLTTTITLTAGQVDNTIDAGLKAASAALGDFVWYDVNRNGIQDTNEKGISGVTVKLYDGSGAVVSSTTTDSTGHYGFTGLAAGSYKVGFTNPTGYKITTQDAGGNDAKDSDANASTGLTGLITLTAGQVNNTIDAGMQTKGGISILKVPCDNVISAGCSVKFTFYVSNTGSTSLSNVKVVDNVGTSASPSLINAAQVLSYGYNVGDTNRDGKLGVGETWQYTSSSTEYGCSTYGSYNGSCGSYNGGCSSYSSVCNSNYDQNTRYDGYGRYSCNTDNSGNHYSCYSSGYTASTSSHNYCSDNSYSCHGGYASNCDSYGNYTGSTSGYCGYSSYDSNSSYGCNNGGYNCYGSSNYNCYSGGYNCYGGSYGGGSYGGSCGTTSGLGFCSAVDTATVTATTSDGLTVSDSDTKSVMVLNNNTPIATDSSCAPTGSLQSLYGAARVIEFTYNPSDTVSLKQVQAGMASVSGHNANQMAFIEISDKADPFAADAHVYFEGNVKAGQEIFADATTNIFTHEQLSGTPTFSQTAGADLYAFVFNSENDFIAGANPIQTAVYNASGSQVMHFGDKIGSLSVVGYIGTKDGYLVSN